MMKLSISTVSFLICSLEEAAGIARALGLEAVNIVGIAAEDVSGVVLHIAPSEVKRVRALEMTIPNLHWGIVAGFRPAINDPDAKVRKKSKELYQRAVDFCHEAGILTITVVPGLVHPGQSLHDARALSADVFNEFVPIASAADVQLTTEPHVKGLFESPESTLELLKAVPGLGLILDYAHFVCQGYTQPSIDPLCQFASDVHLRQAKPGLLQTPLEDGTINFTLVLDQLRHVGYAGYLCLEYVHQDYIGADNVDVITETIKMRDFVREQLRMHS
jgi:sugar phosphate isomerase/epimerase